MFTPAHTYVWTNFDQTLHAYRYQLNERFVVIWMTLTFIQGFSCIKQANIFVMVDCVKLKQECGFVYNIWMFMYVPVYIHIMCLDILNDFVQHCKDSVVSNCTI